MLATPIATYHDESETYFLVGLALLLLLLLLSLWFKDDTDDCFELFELLELEFEFWSSRCGCFRFLTFNIFKMNLY